MSNVVTITITIAAVEFIVASRRSINDKIGA